MAAVSVKKVYCDWSLIDSWRYRICREITGRNTKTPALIAGATFPFPFFPLPFLRLLGRICCVWLFSPVPLWHGNSTILIWTSVWCFLDLKYFVFRLRKISLVFVCLFFFLLGKDELFKTFSVFSRKLFKIFDFSLILKIGGPLCPLVFSM